MLSMHLNSSCRCIHDGNTGYNIAEHSERISLQTFNVTEGCEYVLSWQFKLAIIIYPHKCRYCQYLGPHKERCYICRKICRYGPYFHNFLTEMMHRLLLFSKIMRPYNSSEFYVLKDSLCLLWQGWEDFGKILTSQTCPSWFRSYLDTTSESFLWLSLNSDKNSIN